ncbi:MAG: AI-2E family transporter [Bacteroidetes bacterium GWE2_41_25]|nr:MAG: AI-2E family transporter [Bacteroidetes bacterium GWA2_40_15]OFX83080.1 MAG: AI-2E family transporter [Bacteroidetes bacterium GWC2_40_22]OFY10982.1 MAG: AI-2E family transporter [Bacteroidetes bacterium GWE2_41_25]OFY58762.1 MAG: AI-2E family transporter [Bacteroidetes bacterium GWF2_41_9]HCU20838.1 AI-2E family transporter [Bacteroidales bacterium]
MTDERLKLPFFIRATVFFVGLIALVAILYIARSIIVPLVFAIIIAIVLHPVVNFLVKIRINRIVAISITILATFLIIAAFGALMISQISRFSETLPDLIDNFTKALNQAISWVSGNFEIKPQKIHAWISKTQGELINSSGAAIGQTLVLLGNGLVILFLLPVYIFLILFYHPILIEFIQRLSSDNDKSKVSEIVSKIKTVIQRYLVGLVIEAGIMATLNTTALLILGIQYAFLLGLISAIVNVIPYIGGLVGVALPMMVALATKPSGWHAVYVLIAFYIIQLFDNNFIVPKIVASKVKINALFSIIVVFVGNAIWGIPGMFLSIPLLAVLKLIFDNIESLKPWGFLLGDTMPNILKIKTIFKKGK